MNDGFVKMWDNWSKRCSSVPVYDLWLDEYKNILDENKDNEISVDRIGKKEGRGAYICDDVNCLEKVIKSKRLERVLEIPISKEIYESLRGVIIDK